MDALKTTVERLIDTVSGYITEIEMKNDGVSPDLLTVVAELADIKADME